MADTTETIEITNFSGGLTRNKNGDIKSGLAKFDTSFGYNPFVRPGQLTWFTQLANISPTIGNGVNGIPLAGTSRTESGVLVTYIITSGGYLYRLVGEGVSGSPIHQLVTGSPTFTYGSDITFYGAGNTLYIAHDLGVTKIIIDSAGAYVSETVIGTWDSTHFTPITTKRSFTEFLGLLYVTNSDPSVTYANNIAEISLAGFVNTYTKLNPSLPAGTYIRDLDITPDLTYMLISSSLIPSELLAPVNDTVNTAAGDSALYRWNGTDQGITTGISIPNFGITALQSFGNNEMMFMYDTFGASLYDGDQKVLSMVNNKSPMPNATASTGNFLTWTSPDFYYNLDTSTGSIFGSLYYYGTLEGGAKSLYRMFRAASNIGGNIYQMPYMQFTTSRYVSVNTSNAVQVDSNGTHIFSFTDYSGSGGSTAFNMYLFYVGAQNSLSNIYSSFTAMKGVFETQNQLFSKKIIVKQIRVYCEPTQSGSGFTVDLIGGNGKIVANTANNAYVYAGGTDETKLQGPLERIDFNPVTKSLFSVGLRLTNTGDTNMVINKIEVDWQYSGK